MSNSLTRNHGKPWTPDRKRILAHHYSTGLLIPHLADLFGRTERSIAMTLQSMGIILRPSDEVYLLNPIGRGTPITQAPTYVGPPVKSPSPPAEPDFGTKAREGYDYMKSIKEFLG